MSGSREEEARAGGDVGEGVLRTRRSRPPGTARPMGGRAECHSLRASRR